MKTFSRSMLSRFFALVAALALAFAQGGAQAQSAHVFSQQELDQMLAPIALYPDALLSQVLMAATYPLEVAEAARWSKARSDLSGDAAVRSAEAEDWDPSVKSLVAFPEVLARMEEYPQWTQSLGDAFLDQQSEVMDTVQVLRRRAEAAGNLRSDDRLRVLDSGSGLMLEPINPELVYVPYYDPLVVYGSWWWPAYPPVHWRPWSGYYAQPGYASGFYWGPPVGISAGFFFGAIDWPRRHVRVAHVNNYYYRHGTGANRAVIENRTPGAWRHEPAHRRGIAYRGIEAQQRFGAASAPQGRGNRAGPGDTRFDRRRDARSTVQPAPAPQPAFGVPPADTRFGRRRDGRSTVQPVPAPQSAFGVPPADTRSDRRRDGRSAVQPVPAPQSAFGVPPADTRFDRRRDGRSTVQPAPVAPPAFGVPPADTRSDRRRDGRSAVQPAPAPQSAFGVPPADTRSDRRRDGRSAVQFAPPAAAMQHAPAAQPAPAMRPAPPAPVRAAPVMQQAPVARPAPAFGGNRQAERNEPGARRDARFGGEARAR